MSLFNWLQKSRDSYVDDAASARSTIQQLFSKVPTESLPAFDVSLRQNLGYRDDGSDPLPISLREIEWREAKTIRSSSA